MTPHTDPTNPKYLRLAWRLFRELGRSPTKLELRAHGVPVVVRTNEILTAAGLPLRSLGGQPGNRNQSRGNVAAQDAVGQAKAVGTLKEYRFVKPIEDLPLTSDWMD